MSVEDLRRAITQDCDIIQAICSFNYAFHAVDKERLDTIRKELAFYPRRKLQTLHEMLKQRATYASDLYGCRMKPAVFAREFIQKSRAYSAMDVPLISKADIDSVYFRNFANGEKTWPARSPHLLLFVHCDWVISPRGVLFHYVLPEAILYEDMALAYNSAAELLPSLEGKTEPGPNLEEKRCGLFLRTAVLSAFYFVEAFLNGLAFDFCYLNSAKISKEDQDFLLERPSSQNKRGTVSFEKKAKQYMRIILNQKHAPLTETNCNSLKFLLTEAKEVRDAIVHQSPKLYPESGISEKIRWMMGLRMDKVTEVVDAAVGFVTKAHEVAGAKAEMNWLYPRSSNGLFPPESFQ